MAFVGGVAQGDHIAQPHFVWQGQQLAQGRAVDGPHDAAAYAVCPGGCGQAAQRKAGVDVAAAGQGFVLQHGNKRGRRFVGFGRALLLRQIGGPMHQRLHGGNGFGALHHHVFQRLAVGTAAGNAGSVHTLPQNLGFYRVLCKPAVGAARAQKFHHIHSQHILAACFTARRAAV